MLFAHQRPFWPPWRRLFAQPVETIDGMLCDMLAAIERKNCEHRRGIWQCGFRAIRSRGGAPLSPVTFSVVAGLFRARLTARYTELAPDRFKDFWR